MTSDCSLFLSPALFLQPATSVTDLLRYNDRSCYYGLTLSPADARMLIESRNESLRRFGRLEIGNGILPRLVETFLDSGYLRQSTYADILRELTEIFYHAKNETGDQISDLELLEIMKDAFNHRCQGSLELLRDRDLEALANNLRHGVADYKNLDQTYVEEPEEKVEEVDWDEKARNWLTDNLNYGDGDEGDWGHLYE